MPILPTFYNITLIIDDDRLQMNAKIVKSHVTLGKSLEVIYPAYSCAHCSQFVY